MSFVPLYMWLFCMRGFDGITTTISKQGSIQATTLIKLTTTIRWQTSIHIAQFDFHIAMMRVYLPEYICNDGQICNSKLNQFMLNQRVFLFGYRQQTTSSSHRTQNKGSHGVVAHHAVIIMYARVHCVYHSHHVDIHWHINEVYCTGNATRADVMFNVHSKFTIFSYISNSKQKQQISGCSTINIINEKI